MYIVVTTTEHTRDCEAYTDLRSAAIHAQNELLGIGIKETGLVKTIESQMYYSGENKFKDVRTDIYKVKVKGTRDLSHH